MEDELQLTVPVAPFLCFFFFLMSLFIFGCTGSLLLCFLCLWWGGLLFTAVHGVWLQ